MQSNKSDKNIFTFFLPLLCVLFLITVDFKILRVFGHQMLINELGVELGNAIADGFFWPYKLDMMAVQLSIVALCFVFSPKTLAKWSFGVFVLINFIFGFCLPYVELLDKQTAATLFYEFSSMWMVLGFCFFWGYVNDKCNIYDAWNYYFAWSGIALLFGYLFVDRLLLEYLKKPDSAQLTFVCLISTGLLILALLQWIDAQTSKKVVAKGVKRENKLQENTPHIKLNSWIFLPYAFGLAAIPVACSIALSFLKKGWKWHAKMNLIGAEEYTHYFDRVFHMTLPGRFFLLAILFMGMLILTNHVRWKTVSMVGPMLMLGFGSLFFGLSFLGESMQSASSLTDGSSSQIALKIMMYLYFFPISIKSYFVIPTLQMAYLPLNPKFRLGILVSIQFVILGVGEKISKFVSNSLLIFMGENSALQNYFLIFFLAMMIWLLSVRILGSLFESPKAVRHKA